MKRFIPLLLLVTLTNSVAASKISFTENLGQWDSSIRFKANIPGGFLCVKDHAIEYLFYDSKTLGHLHAQQNSSHPLQIPISIVSVNFKNANTNNRFETLGEVAELKNYFIGNDRSKWRSNAKSCTEVIIKNLYDNIDFRIYTIHGKLKYEYIVYVNGEPKDIQIEYEGVKKLDVTKNELLIETDVNIFKEFNPYTFQQIADKTVSVSTHFVKKKQSCLI